MSVIATALRHLMAAGVSGDALVTAIAEIELAMQPKRSSGAERTARWRAKRHGDVTSVTCDDKKGFDKEIPPTPPKEITSQKINPTSRAKAKSDLPDDWQPDAKTWMLADELGFTSQEAWDQLERMRDWAKNADGGKGRKSDWNAAFRNWLKRASDDRRNRPQTSRQRNGIHATLDAIDACADEAIRRSGGYGAQGGEEDFDELPGLRKSAA